MWMKPRLPCHAFARQAPDLTRKNHITWWGNILFEKALFTRAVPPAGRIGCVAVSGGLEVAQTGC